MLRNIDHRWTFLSYVGRNLVWRSCLVDLDGRLLLGTGRLREGMKRLRKRTCSCFPSHATCVVKAIVSNNSIEEKQTTSNVMTKIQNNNQPYFHLQYFALS